MEEEVVTESEEETEAFGRRLAREISREDVLYLSGELGAGKTCLVRGLAQGLGASSREVASPTFAILHEYGAGDEAPDGRPAGDSVIVLRHLDLYRLGDRESELEVLGLPDSVLGAPIAVEWPGEAIRRALPPTREIQIEVAPDGARRIRLAAQNRKINPPDSSPLAR